MRRCITSIVLTLVIILVGSLQAYSESDNDTLLEVSIGFVIDGPVKAQTEYMDIIKREIEKMASGAFTVRFPSSMSLESDTTVKSINQKLDRLLADPECDMVIMLGLIGSTEALSRTELNKPVIAPFVYDTNLQNAPQEGVGSGVDNLYYIDLNAPIDQELSLFQKLVPFDRLVLLFDERDVAGVPIIAKLGSHLSNEHSIQAQVIPAGNDIDSIMARIPSDTQAVMVGGLWQLDQEEIEEISERFRSRKLPALSLMVSEYLEAGMYSTTRPPRWENQIARQVAVGVNEIVLGENPGSLSTVFSTRNKLSINMETARAIDLYPGLEYMTGTRLINNEQKEADRRITLHSAVEEALKANLDITIAELEVSAGTQEVKEARSALLPRFDVSLSGNHVDEDRAAYARGMDPERSLVGTISGRMLLYSDEVWANYSVQKYSQTDREHLRDSVKLDITYHTSVAYLNVLRRKTIEKIQRDNLELTQANLDRAQIRLSTGVAGPDELYRWQTQFANERRAVLRAESNTFDAMQGLNRLINRPQTETYSTEENNLDDSLLLGGGEIFYELINKPNNFLKLREWAVQNGLLASPELKSIDAQIGAQERLLASARNDYWSPTVSVEARASEYLAEGGSGLRDDTSALDDTDWQVGVVATLPLYEGGRKGAAVARNTLQFRRLKVVRKNTEEQIKQQILHALNNTRASYPAITLSRDAVDAARDNLKLVSDAYVQGVKPIIELLDAQNQALLAELDAADAVYNFLIDLMGLERSIGTFISFLPPDERGKWISDIKSIINPRRKTPSFRSGI